MRQVGARPEDRHHAQAAGARSAGRLHACPGLVEVEGQAIAPGAHHRRQQAGGGDGQRVGRIGQAGDLDPVDGERQRAADGDLAQAGPLGVEIEDRRRVAGGEGLADAAQAADVLAVEDVREVDPALLESLEQRRRPAVRIGRIAGELELVDPRRLSMMGVAHQEQPLRRAARGRAVRTGAEELAAAGQGHPAVRLGEDELELRVGPLEVEDDSVLVDAGLRPLAEVAHPRERAGHDLGRQGRSVGEPQIRTHRSGEPHALGVFGRQVLAKQDGPCRLPFVGGRREGRVEDLRHRHQGDEVLGLAGVEAADAGDQPDAQSLGAGSCGAGQVHEGSPFRPARAADPAALEA